jgi:protein-S-isoprenylcysteine O-methyltransferase Ste14
MKTGELITAFVVFALAGALLVLAVRQFMEKGVPLNNAWLYAAEKERESMDKGPYYRQSAVVFTILGALFVMLGLSLVLHSSIFLFFEIVLAAAAIVYAIASTVRINRRKSR